MTLPTSLLKKLETTFEKTDKLLIQTERHRLSHKYRDKDDSHKRHIENNYQRLSYLATRLPATYAACADVFGRLAEYDLEFSSLLDLGAGPGTASLCAHYTFPELKTFTLMDQDKAFQAFATSFLEAVKPNYHLQDITTVPTFPPHDLTVLSYAINELSPQNATDVIHKAWLSTKSILVIIEPGTPKAFTRLKKIREDLIQYGAQILAPCPHPNACPLGKDDWCHFSVRLERTALHKYIKDASLSYEDEKFSYLIVAKNMDQPRKISRIIKKPRKRSGHVLFDLCTPNGLQQRTLSKKDKFLYKIAQKLEWGDTLETDII